MWAADHELAIFARRNWIPWIMKQNEFYAMWGSAPSSPVIVLLTNPCYSCHKRVFYLVLLISDLYMKKLMHTYSKQVLETTPVVKSRGPREPVLYQY